MKISIPKDGFYEFIIDLLIISVFFRGILENLWDIGTLIMDVICGVLAVFYLFVDRRKPQGQRKYLNYFWSIAIVALIIVLVQAAVGRCSLYRGFIGYRGLILYAITFPVLCKMKELNRFERILRLLSNMGFVLSIFGIVQFIFRERLPDFLITLNEIRKFGVGTTNIVRATGLVGTTIDYGQMCVIFVALYFGQIITKYDRSIMNWTKLIISIVACILTFSRAAIFGMTGIIVFLYLKSSLKKMSINRMIITVVVIILVCFIVYQLSDTIVFYRFSRANSVELARNDSVHWLAICRAGEYIRTYPIIGYTADTQLIEGVVGRVIIADGTIWEYFLQWGIPLTVLWMLFAILIAREAKTLSLSNNLFFSYMGLVLLALTIELFVVSFVNSAWMFRGVYIIYWMLAGMVVACRTSEKKTAWKTDYEFT